MYVLSSFSEIVVSAGWLPPRGVSVWPVGENTGPDSDATVVSPNVLPPRGVSILGVKNPPDSDATVLPPEILLFPEDDDEA